MRWWRRTLGRVGPRELVRPRGPVVVEKQRTTPKAKAGPAKSWQEAWERLAEVCADYEREVSADLREVAEDSGLS